MSQVQKNILTRDNYEQLEKLFDCDSLSHRPDLQLLRIELDTATIVDSEHVPPDVVTLNSTVRLSDSRSSYEDIYTLTSSEDSLAEDHKISVLSPIGTAILGCRVGDLVRWSFLSGMAQFQIEELVYQPERDCVFL